MMRLHRFIGNFSFNTKIFKISDLDVLNQIRNVLRLKSGEEIILSDGNGSEARVRIMNFEKNSFEVEILESFYNINEPKKKCLLYCAVLKRENFELVVQKATEAGVSEIFPLITDRTIKLNIRQDRLEKIIREAAEQSGRGIVPILHEPIKLEDAIKNSTTNNNFIFDVSGTDVSLSEKDRQNDQVNIWIGPEGGWTVNELSLAKSSGFKVLSLGRLTLRAETAAIVATYLVVHNY